MRSTEEISIIKKEISNPISYENVLSAVELDHLIYLFDSEQNKKIYKNTGPITLDLYHYYNDSMVKNLLDRIKLIIGNYDIASAFFFKTNYPHILHNDDTFELPVNVYKAITIPLKLYSESTSIVNHPKLCFFNQFYFHGPSKFFNGDSGISTYYNKQIYNYSDVDGLVDYEFDISWYEKYFTHLKLKWLKGLSFHSSLDWIPGNILIFDSVRLHCSSDFRKLGIKEKLGISIFTKKVE